MGLEPEPKWKKLCHSLFYFIKIFKKNFEKKMFSIKGEKRGDFFDGN